MTLVTALVVVVVDCSGGAAGDGAANGASNHDRQPSKYISLNRQTSAHRTHRHFAAASFHPAALSLLANQISVIP